MQQHEYRFLTRWVVSGKIDEVSDILHDGMALPQWWPSVYLSARQEGEVIHLHTRGLLPYTLRWSFRQTFSNPPQGFGLLAWGDLDGTGEWKLTQQGDEVEVLFDWRVKAEKPILRYFSWLLKPVFSANHRWAMEQGLTSLRLELRRRRGEVVPRPPGPVSDAWLALPLVALLLLGLSHVRPR